jgi:hypothetical protein
MQLAESALQLVSVLHRQRQAIWQDWAPVVVDDWTTHKSPRLRQSPMLVIMAQFMRQIWLVPSHKHEWSLLQAFGVEYADSQVATQEFNVVFHKQTDWLPQAVAFMFTEQSWRHRPAR